MYVFDYSNNRKYIADDILPKVEAFLIHHVYNQTLFAIAASLFCAVIVFIGFALREHNISIYIWSVLFSVVTIFRVMTVILYRHDLSPDHRISFWRNVYIAGALLGGLSWGLAGFLLLPGATNAQELLLMLILAGVTAGAAPLSAPIPLAAMSFLVCSISPFIIMIMFSNNNILHLFNFALTLYLVYTIFIIMRNYRLMRNSVILTFMNDALVKQLEMVNQNLEQVAAHDPLTKAANRRLFSTLIYNAVNHAKENHTNLALLYLDIDKFKLVNDHYGHKAGDQVLLTIINRLNDYFRKEDMISRLGGDEFVIIIENVMNPDDIAVISHKICALIAEPIHWNGNILRVTASVGIAIYPNDGDDEDTMMSSADHNMYVVKKNGGNGYQFSDAFSHVNKTV